MLDLDRRTESASFPTSWLAGVFLVAAALVFAGILNGHLTAYVDAVVIGLLAFTLFSFVGVRMSQETDAQWLPSLVAAGFLAKLMFSTGRYLILVEFYGGSGDATGYHGSGTRLVEVWRSFEVPTSLGIGTDFVDGFTGLLYVPFVPTMIGGFFLFASIAFIGQLLMYAAFRHSGNDKKLKLYAAIIFFLPAIAYWPSSIGKESLMYLGLGLAAYGASLILNRGKMRGIAHVAGGLGFAAAIRPHMAALFIVPLVVAIVASRAGREGRMSRVRHLLLTSVLVVTALVGVRFAAGYFNIDLAGDPTDGVDQVISNLEDNTSKGGSGVAGEAVSSPADIPEATLRVLFRPLPHEAHNAPALLNSLENVMILAFVIWRLPWILKNTLKIRKHPYALMCLVMTLGFIVGFSSFLNLGLLARQRSQILPFLAVVVLQLGWNEQDRDSTTTHGSSMASPVSLRRR